jgi:predicted KAP-like P-loop ATPase
MTSVSDDSNFTSGYFPFSDKAVDGLGERQDELNRQEFCNRVGNMLLANRGSEGLVISIEGEWGSGKSSALGMIRSCLNTQKKSASLEQSKEPTRLRRLTRWFRRQKRKSSLTSDDHAPILVEFNPWLVGAADHMVQAFMAQIASEIGQVNQSAKATEAAQKMIAYAQLLEPLKWIPGAEPWTSIVRGVVEATGKGVGKVSDLHKLNVSKQREALKRALLELGRNIIIFIDDIDRLPPAEVFQIVRAIQAVSDLPRCSFVIALDPLYTEKALQVAANFENPGQYLDKIVQLRLSLPQINKTDLASYFENRLWQALSPSQQDRFQSEQKRLTQMRQKKSPVKRLMQAPKLPKKRQLYPRATRSKRK